MIRFNFNPWFFYLANIIFFMMLFTAQCSDAAVYECVHTEGLIEFRDKPCEVNSVQTLLINNLKEKKEPAPKLSAEDLEETICHYKLQRKKEREERAKQKEILKQQKILKREARLKQRTQKLALQTAEKQQRQIFKQKRQETKIQKIENQLRLGTRLKKHTTLRAELTKATENLQALKEQHKIPSSSLSK